MPGDLLVGIQHLQQHWLTPWGVLMSAPACTVWSVPWVDGGISIKGLFRWFITWSQKDIYSVFVCPEALWKLNKAIICCIIMELDIICKIWNWNRYNWTIIKVMKAHTCKPSRTSIDTASGKSPVSEEIYLTFRIINQKIGLFRSFLISNLTKLIVTAAIAST